MPLKERGTIISLNLVKETYQLYYNYTSTILFEWNGKIGWRGDGISIP